MPKLDSFGRGVYRGPSCKIGINENHFHSTSVNCAKILFQRNPYHAHFRWLIVILVLSGVIAQTPVVSLKSLMTVREFETAGLNKLTKDELQALDSWFMKFVVNFT